MGVKTKIAPSFANIMAIKEAKMLNKIKKLKELIRLNAIKEARCLKKPNLSKLMLSNIRANKATVLSVTMLKTNLMSEKLTTSNK